MRLFDHGYVRLVSSWGSDETVVSSARMSTDGAFRGWPGDERLLRYLLKDPQKPHSSPFEMLGLTVEIQAPIMVFRQIMRHRTFSYNEHSARYSEMPSLYYLPTISRIQRVAGTKSAQAGRVGNAPSDGMARAWLDELRLAYERCDDVYRLGISVGVQRELARSVIPVGAYSRALMQGNLWNWFGFFKKRTGEEVQWETAAVASACRDIAAELFPRSLAAYEGRL